MEFFPVAGQSADDDRQRVRVDDLGLQQIASIPPDHAGRTAD